MQQSNDLTGLIDHLFDQVTLQDKFNHVSNMTFDEIYQLFQPEILQIQQIQEVQQIQQNQQIELIQHILQIQEVEKNQQIEQIQHIEQIQQIEQIEEIQQIFRNGNTTIVNDFTHIDI
jgi:hypothetical protein